MSGIIDRNGVQWEHCMQCHTFVRLTDLGYEKPTPINPKGRDLCINCVDAGIKNRTIKFANIIPSKEWKPVRVRATK